jgi:hypothetical protein
VTLVVLVVVIDAARDALLPSIRDDSVVMLCARDELNVTFVVFVWVMDAASDALLVRMLEDSEVML